MLYYAELPFVPRDLTIDNSAFKIGGLGVAEVS